MRALVFLLAAAAACANTVNFEGTDRGVFFPELRASWPVEAEEGVFVDVAVAHGAGDSSQTVGAGDAIDFEGVSFGGPDTVRAEYRLLVGSVVARWRNEPNEKTELDLYTGIGFTRLDLELSTATERARGTTTSIGVDVGARLLWKPNEKLGLFARVGQKVGFGSGLIVPLTEIDLGAELRPAKRVAVFAGWRWWLYDEDRIGSDIDLEMSGPLAGLRFDF